VLRETDPAGAVDYVYGDGTLMSMRRAGDTSFYLHDAGMSTRMLADSAGAPTDRYEYDAFGNLLSRTGTTPNPYLFDGEYFDPDVRLYHLRARDYDPTTGRFTAADPFPGIIFEPSSLHPYLYAHNDPVNQSDPSGKFTLSEQMTIAAGVGIHAALAYSAHTYYQYRSAEVAFEVGVDAFFTFSSAALDVLGIGALFRSFGMKVIEGVTNVVGGRVLINQTAKNLGKNAQQRLVEVLENVLCRTNNVKRCGLQVIKASQAEAFDRAVKAASAESRLTPAQLRAALDEVPKAAAAAAKKVKIDPSEYTAKELASVTVVAIKDGFKRFIKKLF
jgi:RHS repeat-associated protein